MFLPEFTYHRPTTLKQACKLKVKLKGKASIIAGGTDVLVNMKKRLITPEHLISIRDLSESNTTPNKGKDGIIRIGACATASEIANSKLIQKKFSGIISGADSLGSPLIRNLATIGGNLVTARPAADLAPSLMAHGAKICLAGQKQIREVLAEDFFQAPGKTLIKEDEILTEIAIENPPPLSGSAYVKMGTRRALEIGLVNVAVFITLEKVDGPITSARIVLGSVAPTPIRALKAEKLLVGEKTGDTLFQEAGTIASRECKPIDDFRGSAEYRNEMVKNLTKRALNMALEDVSREE